MTKDKTVNFTRYKTFAWIDGSNAPDELTHARIFDAINAQLSAKHLTQVDLADHPDLLLTYRIGLDQNREITGSDWGGPYRFGIRSASARVREITVGTLVVLIRDAATESLVWRCAASADLDPKASPERRDKNVNKAAAKLLKPIIRPLPQRCRRTLPMTSLRLWASGAAICCCIAMPPAAQHTPSRIAVVLDQASPRLEPMVNAFRREVEGFLRAEGLNTAVGPAPATTAVLRLSNRTQSGTPPYR
jgi:hypothetical protein